MMISYLHLLRIAASSQTILHDYRTNLLHLVWLGMTVLRLQVEDLHYPFLREDVVVASDALIEPQPAHKLTQTAERDVCIGATAQDSQQTFPVLGHPSFLHQRRLEA
jgi:hypothetical protein